ncbi:MAG: RagB/SusD family nutrient uptake outer membrane protein [Chitinophagaceae bacterium]|nr:RagB/SusD family nutrient uptake outer membrane protein [Chitinophagaceae bacterium]
MKKTSIYILLLFAITVSSLSCKKFLDKQPITEKGPEFVFSNSETTLHAIAGVYAQLAGDQGFGKVLSLYFPVDNDETQGPTGSVENGRRDISRYSLTAANAEIQRPFEQCFRGIEYANICITNIPEMDAYSNGSEIEKGKLKRMHGEAIALRAQFYFEAIKNWGDLPAHFQPASTLAVSNPFPFRVNRDSLYDRIIADLKTAADLVPWANELSSIGDEANERITKGTVKALRARIALFRGGYSLRQNSRTMERSTDYAEFYQIAKEECADIMASGVHNLNASYKDLWKNKVCGRVIADPDNELMFQVGSIGRSAVADTKLGYYNGPTVNALGNKSINIVPTYFYAFDSTDLRRDVTCAPYTVGSDGVTKTGVGATAIVDGKYRRDWISNPVVAPTDAVQYFGLKWQLIRYPDVLLMFAEAENELNGPTAAAYEAVNKVRRRGFGRPITSASDIDLSAGLGKAAFFDALVKERSFELGGEGLRKYDLIRWNLLGAKILETRAALADLQARTGPYLDFPTSMYYKNGTTADDASMWANSFYFPAPSTSNPPPNATRVAWIGTSINTTILARYAIGFTPGKSELLPIPQASRGANYNLTQNPNY